ncbi:MULTISPECIES: hypothetical protein [unclassified Streptomyces]|uniref:hypothetical protein n=1 Tax=unclassified Streptomyces TaxID=2593676 RepID=UPI003827B27E
MYEFEPVPPTYGISEAVVAHRLRGGERLRAGLPGGYRLTPRTHELHWPVQSGPPRRVPSGAPVRGASHRSACDWSSCSADR